MNGTAVMTAIGAISALRMERTLAACEAATALVAEVMFGRSQAFAPIAHRLKHHPGQIAAAGAIRSALAGSRMIDSGKEEGRLIQDPYSIRCAPHVIGAARDGLTWVLDVLHRELNSVNDNPIVDPERGETVFAGNFYGRPPVGSRFAGFDAGDRRGPGLHRRRTRAATMIGTRMHRLRTAGTRRG